MKNRLIPPAFALLFTLTFSVPAPAAEDVPAISGILNRIGALPAEMIKAKKTDLEIVDGLVLASLQRLPTDKEKETLTKHLSGKTNRDEAVRDLAWALINTKEFSKLHGLDNNVAESLRILNSLPESWGKVKGKEQEKK